MAAAERRAGRSDAVASNHDYHDDQSGLCAPVTVLPVLATLFPHNTHDPPHIAAVDVGIDATAGGLSATHSRRFAPSSFDRFRSNVPRGICPALRAISSTRQSENPNAGRFLKCVNAPVTTSASWIVSSLWFNSRSTAKAICSAVRSYTASSTHSASASTKWDTQAPGAMKDSAVFT